MRENTPSRTAYRVALRRALHQLVDRPIVFEDPIALDIVGAEGRARLEPATLRGESTTDRYLRAFLAARSRFAEDCLAAAVARGAVQYVILGAGLDTFAYRNPFPALRVVEVDFPATQEWKRELLRAAAIPVPPSVAYLPIDFERESLERRLVAAVDVRAVTSFAWLGVSMYLPDDAVLAILRMIAARFPSGSGIVFDYAVDPGRLGWLARHVRQRMADRVAAAGEPWRSHFEPDVLADALRRAGFSAVTDLGADGINRRYFGDRRDGLKVGTLARLIEARI